MSDKSKVGVNVCMGVSPEAFKGIKWSDKNKNGVPQLGELKDNAGQAISDPALVERMAAAYKCYSELQALFGGMKQKPSRQEALAAAMATQQENFTAAIANSQKALAIAKATIERAWQVARTLEPANSLEIRARLLNILE